MDYCVLHNKRDKYSRFNRLVLYKLQRCIVTYSFYFKRTILKPRLTFRIAVRLLKGVNHNSRNNRSDEIETNNKSKTENNQFPCAF